jgi:hypothetical protein
MTCHLNVEPAKNHALRLIGQTMVAEGGFLTSTLTPLKAFQTKASTWR